MKDVMGINTTYVNQSLIKILESYRTVLDSVPSGVLDAIKNYSAISQLEIEGMAESLRKTMETYTQINMSHLSESLSASLREMGKTFALYEQANVSESLKAISESMSIFSESIASEQLKLLQEMDYSMLFSNIIPQSASLSQILDTTYSAVQEELSTDENHDDNFTEDEVQEALQEQVVNPKGFQERVAGWTEKKKIQFFIIWQLLCFIYGNFFQPYFQENIGIPVTAYIVSNVKELPQKGANIICQLKEDIEAIIIEDTNYYYKVSFIDENGKEREGYVAKRNLKKIEKETHEEFEQTTETQK